MTSQLSPAADGIYNITGESSLPNLLTVDVSQQRRGSVGAVWRGSRESPHRSDGSMSEALLLVSDKQRHRSGSHTAASAVAGIGNDVASAAVRGHRKESLHSEADASHSGGSHGGDDVVDGRSSLAEPARLKADIDSLKTKMHSTVERIQQVQTANAEKVTWYLHQTEASPSNRVKAEFEKHNQKSASNIAQLQKKLESYRQKLRDLELRLGVATAAAAAAAAAGAASLQHQQQQQTASHGNGRPGPKTLLRDVGTGLREIRNGVLGSLAVVPYDIRRGVKKVFGSADNLLHLTKSETIEKNPGACSTTDSRSAHDNTSSNLVSKQQQQHTLVGRAEASQSDNGRESSHDKLAEDHSGNDYSPLRRSASSGQKLAFLRQQHQPTNAVDEAETVLEKTKEHLRHVSDEIQLLKVRLDELQDEVTPLQATLPQYNYRCQRLEEQLNDMSDLYQSELSNLKLELSNAQEKLEYKMEERSRDLQEEIENCHTKISKMELQGLRQQQVLNMEGVNNATARVLATKFANVVLFIIAVLLLFTSTLFKIVYPFVNSRWKSAAVVIAIIAIIFASNYWSSVIGLLGISVSRSNPTA